MSWQIRHIRQDVGKNDGNDTDPQVSTRRRLRLINAFGDKKRDCLPVPLTSYQKMLKLNSSHPPKPRKTPFL